MAAGCPGLLLAGDAAGFIDPMTGDGLRFALRGGELAAEAALRELQIGAAGVRTDSPRRGSTSSRGSGGSTAPFASSSGHRERWRSAAVVGARWAAPIRLLIGLAGDVPLALHQRALAFSENGRA